MAKVGTAGGGGGLMPVCSLDLSARSGMGEARDWDREEEFAAPWRTKSKLSRGQPRRL